MFCQRRWVLEMLIFSQKQETICIPPYRAVQSFIVSKLLYYLSLFSTDCFIVQLVSSHFIEKEHIMKHFPLFKEVHILKVLVSNTITYSYSSLLTKSA